MSDYKGWARVLLNSRMSTYFEIKFDWFVQGNPLPFKLHSFDKFLIENHNITSLSAYLCCNVEKSDGVKIDGSKFYVDSKNVS